MSTPITAATLARAAVTGTPAPHPMSRTAAPAGSTSRSPASAGLVSSARAALYRGLHSSEPATTICFGSVGVSLTATSPRQVVAGASRAPKESQPGGSHEVPEVGVTRHEADVVVDAAQRDQGVGQPCAALQPDDRGTQRSR